MAPGIFAMQGFCIKVPDAELFSIQSGAQGQNRIDLIVAEYIKGSPRDSYQIKVVQGTQTTGTPTAPSLTTQDLHFGGSTRQEEIGRVRLTGTAITSVTVTAVTIKGLTQLMQDIAAQAAAYTAADILAKLKTVDGAGSGLDADLLDGQNADAFAPITDRVQDGDVPRRAIQLLAGQDLNLIVGSGFYYCPSDAAAASMGNIPSPRAFELRVTKDAGYQQDFSTYMEPRKIWRRNYYDGRWSAWGLTDAGNANSLNGFTASVYSNANTIIRRDNNGRASISDPTDDVHIANMRYVDSRILYGTGAPPTLQPGQIYVRHG